MSGARATDRDTFKAMLDSFAVCYDEKFIEEDKGSTGDYLGFIANWGVPRKRIWRVTVSEGQDNVGGYGGFFFDADFTEQGKFIAFGVWE